MKMQSKISGHGSPVVLIPGGLTGWMSWDPHALRLASDRRVIQVQLLNVEYGYEQRDLPNDYSVKTESRALKRTLDNLCLPFATDFVAWSYGADVALDFALDNPGMVRTLTLIEPPALWVLRAGGSFPDSLKGIPEMLRDLRGDITDEMLESFMSVIGMVGAGQNPREMPQWTLWRSYKQSLRHSPALSSQYDSLDRLRAFDPPVMLVKGSGSAVFLHSIIERLASNLPNARVAELAGGHAPHIVSMETFLELLASFHDRRQQLKAS